MGFGRRQIVLALCAVGTLSIASGVRARGAAPHEQMQMNMPMNDEWQFMQDGLVFLEFSRQGGPRGGNELIAPNWWMSMASKKIPRGQLTFTGMLSLDPATVGKDGYRELFQV